MEKPVDANEDCVGPASETAGKADGCAGCPSQALCASGEMKKQMAAQSSRDTKIAATLSKISRTILVLSGKGGVGKSTCSAQLAFSLAQRGYKVGLLDVDICGPSVPLMLGLKGHEVHQSSSGWSPVYVPLEDDKNNLEEDQEVGELAVMSIGFLVPVEDSAIIWRGPKKNGLIEQFFTTVDWGELDYLIVDTPPGTSDEHISLVQMLKKHLRPSDGAVIVSTPQEVAMMDVRKEINFCKTTKLNILGLVENMASTSLPLSSLSFCKVNDPDTASGESASNEVLRLIQEKCPELLDYSVQLDMFPKSQGGVQSMANKFGVKFLGRIPLSRSVQAAGEQGRSLKSKEVLRHWIPIVDEIDTLKLALSQKEKNGHSVDIANGASNGSGVIVA